ncbi:hypothetical protein QBC39DRAFT_306108 [Podospora conica]|nr:hypothetical protein QBC39DRAFT_306108 [Schizothecium conicum]
MDKCWFVLGQTHYTAPVYDFHPSMAFGRAQGPLRLGHLLPGPKSVDSIINTDGVLDFPKDMRITKKNTANFRFSRQVDHDVGVDTNLKLPTCTATPVAADTGVLFNKVMGETWDIERLETQITQPTQAYIQKCLQTPEVASWVARNKSLGAWKAYIVTGLMIAHGAVKQERTESSGKGANAGVGADVTGVATAKISAKCGTKTQTKVSGENYDNEDFVWAIRLSLVSDRGIFGNLLSWRGTQYTELEPYTLGAALSSRSDTVDAADFLGKLREKLELGDGVRSVEAFEVEDDSEEPVQQFFVTIDGV